MNADLALRARERLAGTAWSRLPGASAFYRGLLGVADLFVRIGVTANELTLLSLGLSTIAAGLIAADHFAWAALALIASGLCDTFDGAVARASGHATRAGALFDSTADRVADALPLGALALLVGAEPHRALIPLSALTAAFVVSYVRARAEALGAVLPTLWARRAERLVLLIVILLSASVPEERETRLAIALGGIALLGAFSALGAIHALVMAARALGENDSRKPKTAEADAARDAPARKLTTGAR